MKNFIYLLPIFFILNSCEGNSIKSNYGEAAGLQDGDTTGDNNYNRAPVESNKTNVSSAAGNKNSINSNVVDNSQSQTNSSSSFTKTNTNSTKTSNSASRAIATIVKPKPVCDEVRNNNGPDKLLTNSSTFNTGKGRSRNWHLYWVSQNSHIKHSTGSIRRVRRWAHNMTNIETDTFRILLGRGYGGSPYLYSKFDMANNVGGRLMQLASNKLWKLKSNGLKTQRAFACNQDTAAKRKQCEKELEIKSRLGGLLYTDLLNANGVTFRFSTGVRGFRRLSIVRRWRKAGTTNTTEYRHYAFGVRQKLNPICK